MRRYLFTILSALSWTVLLATIYVWRTGMSYSTIIHAGGGDIAGGGYGYNIWVEIGRREALQISWSHSDAYSEGVHLPYWMLATATILASAAFMIPTLLAIRKLTRARRISSDLCAYCGYDLRASPDRCPECGSLVPPHPIQ